MRLRAPAPTISDQKMLHAIRGHGLLGGLPVEDRRHLAGKLEFITLSETQRSYESRCADMDGVIFPLSAVLSLVGTTAEGQVVEVGPVGREGIAGVEAALRTIRQPLVTATVHVPGTALRMDPHRFAQEVDENQSLNRCVRRYMGFLFAQYHLATACNRHHTLEERCARRLLTALDLSRRRRVVLTQHQLAQMLGVSRQSVDRVLQALAEEGIIQLSRGEIEILNSQELKRRSCPCYQVNKRELSALLGLS